MNGIPTPGQTLPTPRLTVVIVAYDSWPDVVRLTESLAASPVVASGRAEVVIVDNASEGPVPVHLAAGWPGVRLIRREENGGFAAGVNAGWRQARGDWLLVLNPDVIAPPDLLDAVLANLEARAARPEPLPGLVGFRLRNPDGSLQPSVGAFPSLARTVWEQLIPRTRRKYQAGWHTRGGSVPWVTGACALIQARMMADLGGMDEDFFLYYEEVALCRSATRRGWRVEFDPSIDVIHLRPLQNRAITPPLRLITRHSKLLYFHKHLPAWQFRTLARLVVLEAAVRGLGSRLWGTAAEVRAWGQIGRIARGMRRGTEPWPRGSAVRILAEAVAAPAPVPPPPAHLGRRARDRHRSRKDSMV